VVFPAPLWQQSIVPYGLTQLLTMRGVPDVSAAARAFHDWLHHKQLVLADEITGSDQRADAERSVSLARDG
jgi:hypothetical protein